MASVNGLPGIDTSRIYFREEIAELWGREPDDDPENLRRWFKTNFLDRGLRVFPTGKRVLVHGGELSEWTLRNSTTRISE